MRLVIQFIQIEPYEEFAVSEFMQLIRMEALEDKITFFNCADKESLVKEDFTFYPFVIVEIEESHLNKLIEIKRRAVNI